jgi:uncharacterized Zn-binding protein involved in type VI secretion
MGVPAAVAGDKITGTCAGHQAIGPTGSPIPAPPMPFSAPLTTGVSTTVTIQHKPVALVGSWGLSVPPHVGLHAGDPHMAPPTQKGTVMAGSATVKVEGKALATQSSSCTMCMGPAMSLVATATTVLVG